MLTRARREVIICTMCMRMCMHACVHKCVTQFSLKLDANFGCQCVHRDAVFMKKNISALEANIGWQEA